MPATGDVKPPRKLALHGLYHAESSDVSRKTYTLRKTLVGSKRSRNSRISTAELRWGALGLVGLGAVLAWAVLDVVPGIERRILSGVQRAISPIVTSPVMVSVHGRTTTITGDAASEDERLALITAIEQSPGVSEVVDRLSLTSATRGAPIDASQDASGAAAGEVPPPTPTMGSSSIERASADEEPAMAPEPEQAQDTLAYESDAPTGGTPVPDEPTRPDTSLATADLTSDEAATPSPAELAAPSLSISVSNNALTLEGSMDPSVDMTRLIKPALEAFNPSYLTNLIDTSTATSDADWLQPLAGLLPQISELSSPSIDITDRQITLSGTAESRDIHDAIISAALAELSDYSLVERIDVASADADKPSERSADTSADTSAESMSEITTDTSSKNPTLAIFDAFEALEDRRILFAPSSVTLVDDSDKRLDTIAELFKRFPDVKIEIEGHTDTSGDADANMRLSQQRAATVRQALIERGIDGSRLVAYGYGEGVPIVDNATPEGRARNRRIEFRFPTNGF